ncbi:MAG TPA: DUF4105 domain-containing protein [Puia sp.]|jgi:hypothetical protein|nr:DUF4105 domain-containing protein [Puia sp.]
MRIVIFSIFFVCSFPSWSQTNKDSCTMEISLLTCSPGTELYSLFGHTAIRIQDTLRGMDIVYNYGTFDDSDPLFYFYFTRGIMLYSLSVSTFKEFMMEYESEHRNVIAQILNLSCAEKYRLYDSLRKNTMDENRLYQYHFHTDNCTTRAARIIESNTSDSLIYKDIFPVNSSVVTPPANSSISGPGMSYRDMIHKYLEREHQDWPEFGIDMLLGKNLDIKPTNIEAIHFLPDYLYLGIDSAHDGVKPMVVERKTLLQFPPVKMSAGWFTPMLFFTLLLILSVWLYFLKDNPKAVTGLLIFDFVFFTLLGLIGLLMTYMWLGRIDDVCRNNINILWALPTHIVAVFFIRKKAAWVKYYFLITAILAALLLIGFPFGIQRMNTAVLPILIIIIFRSYNLYKNRNYAKKHSVR